MIGKEGELAGSFTQGPPARSDTAVSSGDHVIYNTKNFLWILTESLAPLLYLEAWLRHSLLEVLVSLSPS